MSTISLALEIAAHALAGKTDKAGEPLILHTMRVVLAMDRYFAPGSERDQARIVAALHDVLEENRGCILSEERWGTSVVAAVSALTRNPGEEYLGAYIPRVIAGGRIACFVKRADLNDNLERPIPGEPEAAKLSRLDRYLKAHRLIASGVLDLDAEAAGAAQAEARGE